MNNNHDKRRPVSYSSQGAVYHGCGNRKFFGSLLFILALLLLEEGEVLGVAGLLHLFAGDEAQGRAIDAVA